ncbi:SP_1767 family glycosyltransferase [Lactiplantibacillus plantarum]|uniref:SP_1767 family glycosyltransferase n=1 Tax=Lactiplantibacillus plantarum TaxID=1590 RepID=UPI003855445D|nr:hypothetical protein [Lactiplantibacillus plantarum]
MKIEQKIKKNKFIQYIFKHTELSLCIFHPIMYAKYLRNIKKFRGIQVLNIEDSIRYLSRNHVSVSRFGDGEFRWILGIDHDSFQIDSDELSKRLKEVLESSDSKEHVVAIPDVFSGVSDLTKDDAWSWINLINNYGAQWLPMFTPKKLYLDANITRPYIDRADKSKSEKYFAEFKTIWKGRDVLIVEGEKTRFGVGNDLLNSASSVCRIVCPATNAFSKYSTIRKAVENECYLKNKLVLVALGPTATVLCYDLCKSNIQSIDVGHLDVEYEWFTSGETVKRPVPGKYVNEVKDGRSVDDEVNPQYRSEIIEEIK